jgi:hypothetical protein
MARVGAPEYSFLNRMYDFYCFNDRKEIARANPPYHYLTNTPSKIYTYLL